MRQAGRTPKRMPVPMVRATAYNSTVAFIPMSGTGSTFRGSSCGTAPSAQNAARMPALPPIVESATLSVSSWRTRRPRLAPIAVRTAISFCREIARESSRFAMLAQAINSTHATAPSSISSAVCSCALTNVSKNEMRWMPQSRTSGYCSPTRAAIASISACACGSEMPCFRRPATKITWLRRISFAGSIVRGV